MSTFQEFKTGTLQLFEKETSLEMLSNAPTQRKILEYVIAKHDLPPYGTLPSRNQIRQDLSVYDYTIGNKSLLIKQGLLLRVGLNELLREYCRLEGHKWLIPDCLKQSIENEVETLAGRYGREMSWRDMLASPRLLHIYYIARVMRQGVPLFIRIFPNSPYASAFSQARMAAKDSKRKN